MQEILSYLNKATLGLTQTGEVKSGPNFIEFSLYKPVTLVINAEEQYDVVLETFCLHWGAPRFLGYVATDAIFLEVPNFVRRALRQFSFTGCTLQVLADDLPVLVCENYREPFGRVREYPHKILAISGDWLEGQDKELHRLCTKYWLTLIG